MKRIVKDKRLRKNVAKYAQKRRLLKRIASNQQLDQNTQWEARLELNKLPRKRSPSRIRNRCLITGRGRGMLDKKFKLSRIKFRELASDALLPGITKAVW